MTRHMMKHINRELRKTFKCEICDANLISREGLLRHQKKLHSPKEYKLSCEECEEKFCTISSLKNHLKVKHGVQQYYGCSTCDKFFESARGLTTHQKACKAAKAK